MQPPSVDFVYWTFSAASQSVAAFVAFLLTGYALVHNLMESARERDDTLDELHTTLRASYHNRLAVLAWLTGAAIVLSLVLVYINRPTNPVPGWLIAIVALIDVGAVVAGLHFVVTIVDPKKYERAAIKAIQEEVKPVSSASPANEFFEAFLHLERLVRDYLRERDLYVPSRGAARMSYSFRQMLEALRVNEKIDADFYSQLLEINRYRNLVFHGHQAEVDATLVQRVKEASRRVESLQ